MLFELVSQETECALEEVASSILIFEVQALCDLAECKALECVQLEHATLPLRQPGDRFLDVAGKFVADRSFRRRGEGTLSLVEARHCDILITSVDLLWWLETM